MVGDPPTLTLTRNGREVDGSIRLLPNMKGITLVPDGFLLPGTEHVATLTVGELISGVVRTEAHTFTTGDAIPAPDLTGRVYSFVLEAECIIEPLGAEIIFSVVPIPPLLINYGEHLGRDLFGYAYCSWRTEPWSGHHHHCISGFAYWPVTPNHRFACRVNCGHRPKNLRPVALAG